MPPERLDYEPVAKHDTSARGLVVRVGKLFALVYLVVVAGLTAVNVFLPVSMPWPELFYGPAISIGGCFIVCAAAVWIGSRRNRRDS